MHSLTKRASSSHVVDTKIGAMTSFDRWFLSLMESFVKEKEDKEFILATIGFTCWGIWKERCTAIFSKKIIVVQEAIGRIRASISEFLSLKKALSSFVFVPRVRQQQEDFWSAPPRDWIKINCDGSFLPTNGNASIGVVIQDHHGRLIDGLNREIKAESALVAEAWAVLEGINLAVEKSRKANSAADWVASQTITRKCCQDWVSRPPSSLVHILNKDGLLAPPSFYRD
ncbi:hypothetical protein DITRI_Ditri13aG0085300 [Diplodiscus trichospermus]